MRAPPPFLVLVAVFMVAVGATAGAVMLELRAPIERHVRARVLANPAVHGLAGAAEYDAEVVERAVFAVEAGLSFLHTHASGLGVVALLAASLVATLVPWRGARWALQGLLAVGGLFPLGYLVYALAVLERGRDAGIELAERSVLTPLGSAVVVALVGLVVALALRRPVGASR